MLINIWHGNWKNQLKRKNKKVDEDNEKVLGMVMCIIKKFVGFVGRILVVLFQLLPLVFGGRGYGIRERI